MVYALERAGWTTLLNYGLLLAFWKRLDWVNYTIIIIVTANYPTQ
jgi:hypothetical protein